MKTIEQIYVNGEFVVPQGEEVLQILNPSNNQVIGSVRLGHEADAQAAIHAARQAFRTFSRTSIEERCVYLQRLHDAILERIDDLREATTLEYGAPYQRAAWSNRLAAQTFLDFKQILETGYAFGRTMGRSNVRMEPLGVTAIFTSWNSNAGSICIKVAPAIAAGCTVVIKPSEFSAIQTQILTECFHKAGLPPGVINVVNGRGDVLGRELATHPHIAKIAFTGSTHVGKIIARAAVDTMKRVTLELSGKSANIILDDADLREAVPLAVMACFNNNGQACIAGSRLLVPESRLHEVEAIVATEVNRINVGDPFKAETQIGPLANRTQYDRVQEYIQSGIEEGAKLLAGGLGHPEGRAGGNFVKPTAFSQVYPTMRIAREEIFGPVLAIIAYKDEEEAIRIANSSPYGLMAYVSSSNIARANRVAERLEAGRVLINCLEHDPLAPFGGFKQSGIGREGGVFGLEEFLEPKAIIAKPFA